MNEKELPAQTPEQLHFNPPQNPIDYNGHVPNEVRGYGQVPNVTVEVQTPKVKQGRDKAVYTRQQKGHSLILQFCVVGIFTLWIVPLYYAFSPNHYYHI